MKDRFEKIFIMGVRIDVVKLNELIDFLSLSVIENRKVVISYVNVHAINIAKKLSWFRDFINRSQVVFCDGVGVKWAARVVAGKKLQRFTPPDWFGHLANECAHHDFSMFFLGTQQYIVEKAAEKLKATYPDLNIVGTHHGFFDKEFYSSENRHVLDMINALKPDILVVGFGMPLQEKWIMENLNELKVNAIIPVGAFFDYMADEVARAPRWMTDNGLEWLGRLIIEPRRLWKRYIIGNPIFFWRVFKHHILKIPPRN